MGVEGSSNSQSLHNSPSNAGCLCVVMETVVMVMVSGGGPGEW